MAQRADWYGVEAELCPRKPLQPGARTVTSKAPQVHHDDAVSDLGLAVCLWVESRTTQELYTSKLEQFLPKAAGEDRVTIAHNRTRKAMKPDDVLEESSSHRLCGVGVTQGDEMSHLGEAVNDGQDDRLATDPREPFHEVHGDVAPNLRWHRQGLEKTSWVEMFGIIALTQRSHERRSGPADEAGCCRRKTAAGGGFFGHPHDQPHEHHGGVVATNWSPPE